MIRGLGRDQLPALALKPRRVAPERDHAGEGDQPLLPKSDHAFELLLDQVDLPALGLDLLGEATDLLPKLVGAFAKLRFLPVPCLYPPATLSFPSPGSTRSSPREA